MDTQDNINIFALTDCHQEVRKLCCLFSGIIRRAPKNGANTLICDCGDLFKGIYDRELCIKSYLQLRQQLPEAKIVMALGNNDFGFSNENFQFLKQAVQKFNHANIHVICANLRDLNTGYCPEWVDPYILLQIGNKKILVTAFCIAYIKLQKYGVELFNVSEAFLKLTDTVKHIKPDAFIILNHDLMPGSLNLTNIAKENDIFIDLLIGGHEHAKLQPDPENRIYYPYAFSRTMLQFNMLFSDKEHTSLKFNGEIYYNKENIYPVFNDFLEAYEKNAGLNIAVAPSILNLERQYASPCAIGTFIADLMKKAAHADIGLISTGYIVHALRYEEGKILTYYNIERAFSAETPLQKVSIHPQDLKNIFNNALRYRYIQKSGNYRFLQASQNLSVVCTRLADNTGAVVQIYVNNEPLFDDKGASLHPEDFISCAIDPFIGSGEIGFEAFRKYPKETLIKNSQLVRIKDLFIKALKEAPSNYAEGTEYPYYRITDAES